MTETRIIPGAVVPVDMEVIVEGDIHRWRPRNIDRINLHPPWQHWFYFPTDQNGVVPNYYSWLEPRENWNTAPPLPSQKRVLEPDPDEIQFLGETFFRRKSPTSTLFVQTSTRGGVNPEEPDTFIRPPPEPYFRQDGEFYPWWNILDIPGGNWDAFGGSQFTSGLASSFHVYNPAFDGVGSSLAVEMLAVNVDVSLAVRALSARARAPSAGVSDTFFFQAVLPNQDIQQHPLGVQIVQLPPDSTVPTASIEEVQLWREYLDSFVGYPIALDGRSIIPIIGSVVRGSYGGYFISTGNPGASNAEEQQLRRTDVHPPGGPLLREVPMARGFVPQMFYLRSTEVVQRGPYPGIRFTFTKDHPEEGFIGQTSPIARVNALPHTIPHPKFLPRNIPEGQTIGAGSFAGTNNLVAGFGTLGDLGFADDPKNLAGMRFYSPTSPNRVDSDGYQQIDFSGNWLIERYSDVSFAFGTKRVKAATFPLVRDFPRIVDVQAALRIEDVIFEDAVRSPVGNLIVSAAHIIEGTFIGELIDLPTIGANVSIRGRTWKLISMRMSARNTRGSVRVRMQRLQGGGFEEEASLSQGFIGQLPEGFGG